MPVVLLWLGWRAIFGGGETVHPADQPPVPVVTAPAQSPDHSAQATRGDTEPDPPEPADLPQRQ